MYSVTPLASGYVLELDTNRTCPRILVKDADGVVCDVWNYDYWEAKRAERAYSIMVALAGGPVSHDGESVAARDAA